ncbi:MAG: cytidine deaminase [Flavobacteriales bacterium]|jgi:cytidine deaminase|nr:cytidine deaminase [Flavobacteriales bacterium]
MKKHQFQLEYSEFPNKEALDTAKQKLLAKAREAQAKAYAPYSNFKVGAALLLENGEIVLGSNQENAAYPSGLCAERVAFFHYGATFSDSKIVSVAIVGGSNKFETLGILSPCGACRQVMFEYEQKQESDIQIILQSDSSEVYVMNSIADILPFGFYEKGLKE